MTESGNKDQEQIPPELEKIVTKFEHLSLTPRPTLPSFVVSETSLGNFSDTEQASKSQKNKSNMAAELVEVELVEEEVDQLPMLKY